MGPSALFCVCVLFGYSAARDVHFYVSPTGSDANNGSSVQHPLKSIAKTLSYARSSSFTAADNVYIELLQGYYDLDHGVTINSHHANSLTIRSYKGQEVHVGGGPRIPLNKFHRVRDTNIKNALPSSARSHVKYVNLPSLNITNYGTMRQYGFHAFRSAPLEVFYDGKPFRMAQWPNKGYTNIVGTPDGKKGLRVQYNSTRPSTWRHVDDLWVYGFWYVAWADKAAKVVSLDTTNMIVTLDNSTKNLIGVRNGNYGDTSSEAGYFRFINVLSELDQPGEYYLDRKTGNLYVWIPSGTNVMQVSTVTSCIVIGNRVSNVILSGFTIEACRERAVFAFNAKNVQVTNMEIRNTGDYAVHFAGDSRSCSISKTVIHDCDGAVFMQGGNRKLLESSGNVVEDCEIYNYNRVSIVGKDAIRTYGVGNLIRYNTVHNGSAPAVRYTGNDHVIEYNNLHHVCVDVAYCGAVYSDNDWTYRGIQIRNNHIHDIVRSVGGGSVIGIMLNHQLSAATVTNNVLYNNEVHLTIDGGRDNIVSQNVFYNATRYTLFTGKGGYGNEEGPLARGLRAVPYNGTLWKARYPKLATIDSHEKTKPEGNEVFTNLVYNDGKHFLSGYTGPLKDTAYYNFTDNGYSFGPGDHFNPDIGDLRLRCHAAVWANQVNFRQVTTPNEVGWRTDIGPSYNKLVHKTVRLTVPSGKCVMFHEPAKTNLPMPSFLPDGAGQTPVHKTFEEGCWLHVDKCTEDPEAAGTYRDMIGERFFQAAENETMCFKRAMEQWKFCGSHYNEMVAAIYGPTGAMTYGGEGCLLAWYGCPKHGGPADGTPAPGRIHHDTAGEKIVNGTMDPEKCLARANGVWKWCGANANHTITSVFLGTGEVRTAGGGCWIETKKCNENPSLRTLFYDAYGATNNFSDEYELSCYARAKDYWTSCGEDPRYPVTAHYRPSSGSATYP